MARELARRWLTCTRGVTMVLMIHRNLRGKEGTIKFKWCSQEGGSGDGFNFLEKCSQEGGKRR